MEQPLRTHVLFLEQRIQELRDQLTAPDRLSQELGRITDLLESAELALVYYRKAYALEQKVVPAGLS